jgi:hypothetical protein
MQGGSGSVRVVRTGHGCPRIEETAYDALGRVAATRLATGAAPWTCIYSDSGGRVTQRIVPAFGRSPARTVTVPLGERRLCCSRRGAV